MWFLGGLGGKGKEGGVLRFGLGGSGGIVGMQVARSGKWQQQ